MTPGVQFKVDLDKWKSLTTRQLQSLARQSILALSERIVETTPVDTNFLRGSWQPSINVLPPPRKENERQDGEAQGFGAAMARITVAVSGLDAGDTFYLTNNAAYARRIEFGFVDTDKLGRRYNQRGQYFVTRAIAQWDAIVDEQARDLGYSR